MSQSDETVEVTTSSPVPQGIVTSPTNQWLLLDANRWVLAALFSAAVFVAFFTLGVSGVIDVAAEDPATLLLSVFIGGNLTLVPVTITINQLVLSREFGKPHELTERDDGVHHLRQGLREVADTPLIDPAPKAFLRTLVTTMDERAEAVHEAVTDADSDEISRQGTVFRRELTKGTRRLAGVLDDADFGSYELLSAMLTVNSAWLLEISRHLQYAHGESVSDESFERMAQTLQLFNVTRQYTKTLYAQRELATLSRLLLYTGFVAVLLSSLGMLVYATPYVTALSMPIRVAAFSALSAVVFTPLAFLLSYMLRLSTLMSYPLLRNSFITDG